MSKEKWDSLKPEHQKMIIESWAEMIPGTRKLAEDRQKSARIEGAKMGVKQNEASPQDLKKMRALLMKEQASIVKQLKMDAKLVAKTRAIIKKLMN
jgi:TRAP-type C4-dicarboxylate transport system substrate-binding protein